MKSKQRYFDKTVFLKNLTRFAPAWGLYTLCLLLGLLMMYADGEEFWLANRMGQCIRIMALVNCAYALLTAQLLFGDLYVSRMCSALHAMPLRRECWFATNIVSGLVFSLGPTLIMALASIPLLAMTCVVNGWQIGLYWLLGANLEYVCFFGLAVFSAFCVGSRFAMALVYGILNGASLLAYFLVDIIYTPMLFGVQTQVEPFFAFCPLGKMIELDLLTVDSYTDAMRLVQQAGGEIAAQFYLTENWWYLWVCAAVGLVLIGVSLLLYRRRKLECAGDFMAVRAMEPVFLVLYTLTAAGMFQLIHDLFFGSGDGYFVFLPVGMVAGWFTGRMLLERSVRVFRGRNFLGLLALSAAVALSLLATYLDVFGIETRIPQAEQVEWVTISYYDYHYGNTGEMTEPEDIENVLRIHAQALEERLDGSTAKYIGTSQPTESAEASESGKETANVALDSDWINSVPITIHYQLRSGAALSRRYYIWPDTEEGQIYKFFLSRPECVLGDSLSLGSDLTYEVRVEGSQSYQARYYPRESVNELLQAVEADCEAGTMAQYPPFHNGFFRDSDNVNASSIWLGIYGENSGLNIGVYPDSENTLAWLEKHGLLEDIEISD